MQSFKSDENVWVVDKHWLDPEWLVLGYLIWLLCTQLQAVLILYIFLLSGTNTASLKLSVRE
jgi:hypothetical protein